MKRVLSMFLTIVLLCGALSSMALAGSNNSASGNWPNGFYPSYTGPGVSWSLNDEGTLYLSGEWPDDLGPYMTDEADGCGWLLYKEQITKVIVQPGMKKIGEGAFLDCKNLKSVSIADGVTSIESYAFSGCENLKSISIPDSVTSIDYYAFDDCYNLSNIYYSGDETQWENFDLGYSVETLVEYYELEIHYNSVQEEIEKGIVIRGKEKLEVGESAEYIIRFSDGTEIPDIEEIKVGYSYDSLNRIYTDKVVLSMSEVGNYKLIASYKGQTTSLDIEVIPSPELKVYYNNRQIVFPDQKPIIEEQSGRTLVPIRAVFEEMGANVGWDEKNTATIDFGDVVITMKVGEKFMTVDGKKISIDSSLQNINGRVYAPVRAVAEAYCCTVTWDENDYAVRINKQESVNKLEVNVEKVTAIYPDDPDSARRIKIKVTNLSEDVIIVTLNGGDGGGGDISIDKAVAAENILVKIGETSCIKVTSSSEHRHNNLAPGASFTLESIVNFECFMQEKCSEKHTLNVTASAKGFTSGSDSIILAKPIYVDPQQQRFDNASVDLAKRATELVNKLCNNTASKTTDDSEIAGLRNAVKNQLKVTNISGKTVSVSDEVYDAFINAIVQGIYGGNIDEELETNQTKLANQIADAIEDGSISGYETVEVDGCSYTVDYDVVTFFGVGFGLATVKWTDKNKIKQTVDIVWASDVEDGVNAVSEYCAKLIELNDALWQDFVAYMATDTLGLMGINSIKKDDVVDVFNKTEKIINAINDEDAAEELVKEIGGEFLNVIKWNGINDFKNYIKKNIPNGDLIVTAADKYKDAKKAYDKWKNLLSDDYDLDKAEDLYNEFQKAYANLEKAINNI